jgi:hypothetical protein
VVVKFQYLIWLWNSNVWHGGGIPVSQIAMEFQCLTWLWNSSVSHGGRISVSDMAVEFKCLTWLWNSSVSHVCVIPVSHMGFYYCIDTFKLRINLQIIWRIMWKINDGQQCRKRGKPRPGHEKVNL